ncbi:hypothetical protein TcWFU_009907 [Taenia crassiceps]|uniref:DUF5734 domain-containing protein n=1 Tax=Taenia crassiceps TaxID=6207 RepID=A0ABR4QVZ0_9CEST
MSQIGFSSEDSRVRAEEGSRTKGTNRNGVALSTRRMFSLDAFDSHPYDLLLSEMGKALKSEKKNVITACGVDGRKATLITLQFETEEEFSKAFGILEKYAKSKNAEAGSQGQEKASEVKLQPELGLNKTGDVPFESRAARTVKNPNFDSYRFNANSPGDSQSSSLQDSLSITALTLTNNESSSSCTDGELTVPAKNFIKNDENQFDDNSLKRCPLPSRRGNQRQLVSSSPTSKNIINPLPPVKIVRRPEKRFGQGKSHRSLSSTSESSSGTNLPQLGLQRPPTQNSKYRMIPVQLPNSRAQSSSCSDSSRSASSCSSGYCETCCSSSSDSTVQFFKGVKFIIPRRSHQHFKSTIDSVWVCSEPDDRGKSKTPSHYRKPCLCFH